MTDDRRRLTDDDLTHLTREEVEALRRAAADERQECLDLITGYLWAWGAPAAEDDRVLQAGADWMRAWDDQYCAEVELARRDDDKLTHKG